jgi:S1-C subfamily serine protease
MPPLFPIVLAALAVGPKAPAAAHAMNSAAPAPDVTKSRAGEGVQAAGLSATAREGAVDAPSASKAFCSGEYADDFASLSARAREFEQRQAPYTYCVRTTADYECPSYAPDGSLRRTLRKAVAHGTAFGYRRQGGETLLATNDHVAEWPAVTDEEHPVSDVPAGCKRVSESLRIVDGEKDDYERDDVPLARVVADAKMDVAVLKAKVALPILPWKIGRSAALRERNIVDVRGFPLGVLRANNMGKVVSAYDHDEERDWEHDDFIVDALLSPGNSGSPVFAISCRTGEFELVGIYHAAYSRGSALNAVVGIDQLRDLLTHLKRSPRPRSDGVAALGGGDRAKLVEAARAEAGALFFPFGGLIAAARARADGALVFALMGKDFPLQPDPVLVIEDLPPAGAGGFGQLGRMWAGNRQGLTLEDRAGLDADAQATTAKLADALRYDALLAAAYRAEARAGMASRERHREVARRERALRRTAASRRDLAQLALDMVDRLCPATADASSTIAEALAVPRPAARATAPGATPPGVPLVASQAGVPRSRSVQAEMRPVPSGRAVPEAPVPGR